MKRNLIQVKGNDLVTINMRLAEYFDKEQCPVLGSIRHLFEQI